MFPFSSGHKIVSVLLLFPISVQRNEIKMIHEGSYWREELGKKLPRSFEEVTVDVPLTNLTPEEVF